MKSMTLTKSNPSVLEDYLLVENHAVWSQDYKYDVRTNEFTHRHFKDTITQTVDGWFDLV